MNKRVLQIGAVVLVALGLIGASLYIVVTTSPRYALYQMYHAAEIGDEATFTGFYQVYVSKTSADAMPPPALEYFKQNYFQPLSPVNAFTKIKALHEKITPDGVILIVQSQSPQVAYQLIKRDGSWIVISAAKLK